MGLKALNVRLIGEEYPNDQMLNKTVKAAIQRTESLNIFMQNFASVVRLPDPIMEPADVVDLLRRIVKIQSGLLNSNNIEIKWDVPSNHLVKMDMFQMEQVMINILINSIESIGKGGTIKIELRNNTLLISDNGDGITEEDAILLFSPFFTTKPKGQGIGLTIIKHVLSGHGFEYSLKNEGDWTVFKLVL